MPLTLVMIGSEENYTPARWVHRQSHLLQEALIEWYNAADVVVLPSIPTVEWIEQYGRVLVEAQACGCPVIATDIGGPRDLVRQNETGFLVPPGNVASLRGAIQRIVEDKVLRDTFRRNARRWYLRQFETTKIERRLAHIYEDVMAEIPPETGIGGVNLEEAEETSGRIEIEA
jgi:glycosyltransferase involved in cell wall biosynthesis